MNIDMNFHETSLQILRCLSDGAFYSLEALTKLFSLSPTEVEKHIEIILSWELDVDLVNVGERGYRLSNPLALLDSTKLREKLGSSFELIPIIDSTNQHLFKKIQQSNKKVATLESGFVCLAEYQSQGRGRRGKKWSSPFGSNLYLSMYWCLKRDISAAMGLSLVMGIATVEALERCGFTGIKLKWPNDLYYQDKKIAGILVETSYQAPSITHVVIGMGLNVNMKQTLTHIDQAWSNLDEVINNILKNKVVLEPKGMLDRNQLTIAIVNAWREILVEYEQHGMPYFIERWQSFDNFMGRKVRLILNSGENEHKNGTIKDIEGIAKGIDQQGALILDTANGQQRYIVGEISLRKND